MNCGAWANIGGKLKEDVIVKNGENGLIYGLIHVLTNPVIKSTNKSQADNAKPNYIPVLLMGMDIITKYGHLLKKGERVWLVGEIRIVENAYITFGSFGFDNIEGLVIIVHDKKRLIISPEDTATPDLRYERI